MALLLGGCAADLPVAVSGGEHVLLRKGDPSPEYAEIGPISAVHGSGCGGFGEKGSHEGAMIVLRNRAAEMGADYVRMDVISEPHLAGGCMVNEYAIRGVAFRRAGSSQPEGKRPPPAATPPSVDARLRKLKELHEGGLITTEEYERKKAEVLKDL